MAIYLLFMVAPIIVYFIMGLFSNKSINENAKLKSRYLIVCGIIMTLMIGLRHPRVGSGDTMFYYTNWEMMSEISISRLFALNLDLEMGYQLFVWLFSQVFHNGQWLLLLSGAFFAISVCFFMKRNCKNVVLALLVFNCLGLFNFMVQGLRQAIAMCICLWAIEQCKKKKLFPFLLLVVLACTFHASAAVFAIVYIISKLKLETKSILIFSICTFICVQLLPYLFEIVNVLINDTYEIGTGAETGGVVAILIYGVIIAFGLIFVDRRDVNYPLFIYMAVLGAAFMIMRNTVSEIIVRIAHYFAFSQMVVLPNSIGSIADKRVQVFINIVVAILCLGIAFYKASYSILIPYTFFWQM